MSVSRCDCDRKRPTASITITLGVVCRVSVDAATISGQRNAHFLYLNVTCAILQLCGYLKTVLNLGDWNYHKFLRCRLFLLDG